MRVMVSATFTAQNMKFSIKDFFSKCDQIRGKLLLWSYLVKKSSMENFIFCIVVDFFVMESEVIGFVDIGSSRCRGKTKRNRIAKEL